MLFGEGTLLVFQSGAFNKYLKWHKGLSTLNLQNFPGNETIWVAHVIGGSSYVFESYAHPGNYMTANATDLNCIKPSTQNGCGALYMSGSITDLSEWYLIDNGNGQYGIVLADSTRTGISYQLYIRADGSLTWDNTAQGGIVNYQSYQNANLNPLQNAGWELWNIIDWTANAKAKLDWVSFRNNVGNGYIRWDLQNTVNMDSFQGPLETWALIKNQDGSNSFNHVSSYYGGSTKNNYLSFGAQNCTVYRNVGCGNSTVTNAISYNEKFKMVQVKDTLYGLEGTRYLQVNIYAFLRGVAGCTFPCGVVNGQGYNATVQVPGYNEVWNVDFLVSASGL